MLDDFYKKGALNRSPRLHIALLMLSSAGWVRPCIDSIHDFEEVLAAYDRLSR